MVLLEMFAIRKLITMIMNDRAIVAHFLFQRNQLH